MDASRAGAVNHPAEVFIDGRFEPPVSAWIPLLGNSATSLTGNAGAILSIGARLMSPALVSGGVTA